MHLDNTGKRQDEDNAVHRQRQAISRSQRVEYSLDAVEKPGSIGHVKAATAIYASPHCNYEERHRCEHHDEIYSIPHIFLDSEDPRKQNDYRQFCKIHFSRA